MQRNINAHLIPPELFINIDQTQLRFYLTPTHTVTKKGEASVPITNSSDYRQITGTFGISMAGEFLPIQLIYHGKTNKHHPNYNFPNGFHITHTPNHWSNETKSLEMIDKVIMPYVKQQIADLQLRKNQEWLLIAEVFRGQWAEAMKKRIAELHGKMVPVPNNMTHVLQPLDLTVNRSCKAHIRKSTHQWATNEVQKQLESGKQPENVKVDTKLSIVKPLHAKWVTSFYDSMQTNKSIVTKG